MHHNLYTLFFATYEELTWWAMVIRGLFIFVLGILLIKLGGKRMNSGEGTFNIVISIMLGTLMAKAIAGNGKFIPLVITCTTMVLSHRFLTWMSYKSLWVERFIKGNSYLLVKDGKVQNDALHRHNITKRDLEEALRSMNISPDISKTKEIHMERSGKISVLIREE